MPIFDIIPNSATTLSVNYRPGQEKRLFASKSEAIFSFGDYTIEKNYSPDVMTSDTQNSQFGTFDNLETLNAVNFSNNISSTSVQQNELNLPSKNPKSYSYFSSFYTNIAASINNIISKFPYAILSQNNGNINIYDYNEQYNAITFEKSSSFKIPFSGLTNQGGIALASANTEDNFSLPYDYKDFCIQISGGTDILNIKNYIFSGTYLYFEVVGYLQKDNTGSTYTDSIYIRPTKGRVYDYNNSITTLERQLLNDGVFLIPDIDTPQDDFLEQRFIWPRTIDGFSPDSYGSAFESYKDNLLMAAEKVDDEKTNIFIRTVIPENYLELDSQRQIYRTIVQTYSYEFDKLKNYIDAIAYAHSIEYNGEETVPKKFLTKLSGLLGWKLSDGFGDLDLFDYLTTDLDEQENSFSYFNMEVWRRILINLVWLYKKKGTRDAIMFIFKLIGAPDCLINFNEFVYDIVQTTSNITNKVDVDGYINYSSSQYAFQEGGKGRGNGELYINQWMPEFNPLMRVDNNKIEIGDPIFGTRSIVNTKKLDIGFSPAQAIECDVFQYYQQSGSCWNYGSYFPPFSCLTIPYEYLTFSCNNVSPANITAMTLTQYIDYIYTNSIDPTNRKTNAQCHTSWSYPELKNMYMAYYYATCPSGHSLTMCKLENYLQLLEIQLGDYILQLIPATTIFDDSVPAIYKNTVFNRQRFVYKEGVDKGSMFKKKITTQITPNIEYICLNTAKIHVFAGFNNIQIGSKDITGNSWRLLNNIPPQNIFPSAKNISVNNISAKKIETIISGVKKGVTKVNYIITKSCKLNSYKIACKINNNLIFSTVDAVSVSTAGISDTTQIFVNGQIFNH